MAEGVGRPAHQPTDQNRLQVKTLAAVGIRHEDIATKLGISADTLTKYYRHRLLAGLGVSCLNPKPKP